MRANAASESAWIAVHEPVDPSYLYDEEGCRTEGEMRREGGRRRAGPAVECRHERVGRDEGAGEQ